MWAKGAGISTCGVREQPVGRSGRKERAQQGRRQGNSDAWAQGGQPTTPLTVTPCSPCALRLPTACPHLAQPVDGSVANIKRVLHHRCIPLAVRHHVAVALAGELQGWRCRRCRGGGQVDRWSCAWVQRAGGQAGKTVLCKSLLDCVDPPQQVPTSHAHGHTHAHKREAWRDTAGSMGALPLSSLSLTWNV